MDVLETLDIIDLVGHTITDNQSNDGKEAIDLPGYAVTDNQSNDGEEHAPLGPKRYLVDVRNPLELYTNQEFIKRYRFSKEIVIQLWDWIKDDTELTLRAHALPAILQLTCALRFFATGCFQQTDDGELARVSRRTAQRSIHRISRAICHKKRKFISFPGGDITDVKRSFHEIAGFPNVIGVLDCTHIPISSPRVNNAEVFRNRKHFLSLNVQAVCNADRMVTNIVVRWPGSTPDSHIFKNSTLRAQFEDGHHQGILLGDNGYGLEPYLMTPILNAATKAEIRYNEAHVATRAHIEQCFSLAKQRFHALQMPLRTELSNSLPIIVAIFCMHNFALKSKQPLFGEEVDESEFQVPLDNVNTVPQDAQSARECLISRYFSG